MRTTATLAVVLAMALMLALQHVNGGVPAHHLFANPELPSLSNWWGLLTMPLLAWFLLGRIALRRQRDPHAPHGDMAAFAGGLVFGIVLSFLFTAGQGATATDLVLFLPLLALLYPIYRAACVLGFVIAMSWAFGPVLPLLAAAVFAAVGALLHHGVRLAFARIGPLLR